MSYFISVALKVGTSLLLCKIILIVCIISSSYAGVGSLNFCTNLCLKIFN